jgi:hypothetical protein
MKTVTESVVVACAPEDYWKMLFDESYLRTLYLEELKFKGFTVLEMADPTRKLRLEPKLNVPGVIEKLIGDRFAYEEHGTLDRAKNEWSWRMVQPSQLDPKAKPKKDVVSTRGTTRIEPAGDGKTRRTDTVHIEAKVFGIGGIIESSVIKELHASWAKEFAFLDRWLRQR